MKKSLLKTITWRIVATSDTLLLSYVFTGSLAIAGSIAGLEVLTKMVLYYFHERVWEKEK